MSNEMTGASAIDRDNPWPGLATFTEDQSGLFHGRDAEIRDLARRTERNPLTVLFGQSGLGKSSLLQAGVFPRLRAASYWPIYVRLDHSPGAPTPTEQVKALVAADTVRAGTWTKPGSAKPGEALWEFFHHRDDRLVDANGKTIVPVLVFDQFEELFTLGAGIGGGPERARAVAFISELAELVENRPSEQLVARLEESSAEMDAFDFSRTDYRVVISLREDFLPHLESLKTIMPALMENRMRLARMTGTQALEAVVKPGGALVTPEVAQAIVEFVAGARGGSAERMAELDVEPPLLSVICRELNERRRALGQTQITADLVSGNRREILTDFYERSVSDLPAPMRAFVEDRLLTKSGFRDNLALETALEEPGVTQPLIDTLVARRLLRIEDRIGVQRVELTHDVLAEVIRASRDARQQRLALAEARQREQLALAVAARRTRKQRWIIGGLSAAVVALCIGAVFGIRAQRRAEQAARDEAAQSSRTDFVFGAQFFETDNVPHGLAYLVRAAKSDPTNHLIGPRLLSALAYRSFAEPAGAPLQHPAEVRSTFYLSGGQRIQTFALDSTFRYWDAEDGRLLQTIEARGLAAADRSADGSRLAVGRADGTVQVWNLATGERALEPLRHGQRIVAVRFSPDGRWLVSSSFDAVMKIWDAGTGREMSMLSFKTTGRNARLIAISPDSRSVVTTESAVQFWRLPEGTLERSVAVASAVGAQAAAVGAEMAPAFSPDGKLLAVIGEGGGFVQIRDAATGEPVVRLAHGGPMGIHGRFSEDGKKFVTVGIDGIARVWEIPSGRALSPALQHGGDIFVTRFTPDGRHLLVVSTDGVVRVWDLARNRLAIEPVSAGDIRNADFHPTRPEFITAGRDGLVQRWRFAPGAAAPKEMEVLAGRIGLPQRDPSGTATAWTFFPDRMLKTDLLTGTQIGPARMLPTAIRAPVPTVSPDGRKLVVRTDADDLELWQLGADGIVRHKLGRFAAASQVRFSHDSLRVAAVTGQGLSVWDTTEAERIVGPFENLQVRAPLAATTVFAEIFSADSRLLVALATTVDSFSIVDLQARTVTPPSSLGALGATTFPAVSISPDGRLLAIVLSSSVQLWDRTTSAPLGEPIQLRNIARGAIFSRDSRRLLTWTRLEAELWDVATQTPLTEPMLTKANTFQALFSPDETRIVTLAQGSARLWDSATGHMIAEPFPVAGSVPNPLSFTADGRFLLSGRLGGQQTLLVWPLPPPTSGQPVPEWLLRLASALAGGEIDRHARFRPQALDAKIFDDLRRELAALPDDAPYVEWGRWFLADRATRPIAPGFTITPAEAEKLAKEMTPATPAANPELPPPPAAPVPTP